MELAFLVNVHSDPATIIDTVSSIFEYGSANILVLVNGASWDELSSLEVPVPKVKGLPHTSRRSPYRNVALGLKLLTEQWPNADWYCYTEYDTLFASNRFQHNLKLAEANGVWMLGSNGRVDESQMPLVESLVGEKFRSVYYLLGCCLFLHKDFVHKLNSIDFFDRFLFLTNSFSDGHFPAYNGYDISEHMYPTLCRHFGGKVGVFSTWDEMKAEWHGSYKYFPLRWKPELNAETENFPEASILHPLKSADHPIRQHHKERRTKWNPQK